MTVNLSDVAVGLGVGQSPALNSAALLYSLCSLLKNLIEPLPEACTEDWHVQVPIHKSTKANLFTTATRVVLPLYPFVHPWLLYHECKR